MNISCHIYLLTFPLFLSHLKPHCFAHESDSHFHIADCLNLICQSDSSRAITCNLWSVSWLHCTPLSVKASLQDSFFPLYLTSVCFFFSFTGTGCFCAGRTGLSPFFFMLQIVFTSWSLWNKTVLHSFSNPAGVTTASSFYLYSWLC